LGYIFVTQDVRGRYRSEGRFEHMTPHKAVKRGARDVDESSDTYDTIEWLLRNTSHHNGRVGLWGISYGGFFTTAGMIDAHPALKAASPQAPQTDWFLGDDTHHNGAFFLTSTFNFMLMCGMRGEGTSMSCGRPVDFGTDDGYRFFLEMGPLANAERKYFKGKSPGWSDMMRHGTYDSFWKARNILAHEAIEVGGAHRGRVVRRQQLLRRVALYQPSRSRASTQRHRHRPVVPRAVGA
jgi:hypothetical protein